MTHDILVETVKWLQVPQAERPWAHAQIRWQEDGRCSGNRADHSVAELETTPNAARHKKTVAVVAMCAFSLKLRLCFGLASLLHFHLAVCRLFLPLLFAIFVFRVYERGCVRNKCTCSFLRKTACVRVSVMCGEGCLCLFVFFGSLYSFFIRQGGPVIGQL